MTLKEEYLEIVHRYFEEGEQWKKDPLLLIDKIEFDAFLNDVNSLFGLSVSKAELQKLSRRSNEDYSFEKLFDFFDEYKPGINTKKVEMAYADEATVIPVEASSFVPSDSENGMQIVRHPSRAYNCMLKGQYDEAVSLLLNNNTQTNELRNFINAINDDLHENKLHAEDIKNRNFFQRIISSNTKDIGNVLFEQNISLSAFFVFLRLLSVSSQADRKLLINLYEYAEKESKVSGGAQSSIQKGIIAILKKNEEEFKQNEIRDRALMKLLKEAQDIEDFKNGLSQLVSQIEQKYEETERKLQDNYKTEIQSIRTDIETQADKINQKADKIELSKYAPKDQVYLRDEINKSLDNKVNNSKLTQVLIAYGVTTVTLLIGLIVCFLI